MKDFKEEFSKFKQKIIDKENFAFFRFADGEVAIMRNEGIPKNSQAGIDDRWNCEAKNYKLGKDLISAVELKDSKAFYAIPSPNQRIGDYLYLKSLIKVPESNLTFSDIWINSNYQAFKNFLTKELTRDIILIANHEAKETVVTKKVGNFNIISFMAMPDDCVNFYEEKSEAFLKLLDIYKNYNDTLFLISAGPLSEVIIFYLFKNNPNNTYIDVGSAIDEVFKNKITRPYVNGYFSTNTPVWD